MNLNPHPDWNQRMRWRQVRTQSTNSNPLPRWARWLAVALVFGGYAVLEAHDAQIGQTIAKPTTSVARN